MSRPAANARRGATVSLGPRTEPYLVSVIDPGGKPLREISCRDADQCMEVVEDEAFVAPLWTLLLLYELRRGQRRPVARWAVGPRGLGRLGYRPNAAENRPRQTQHRGWYIDVAQSPDGSWSARYGQLRRFPRERWRLALMGDYDAGKAPTRRAAVAQAKHEIDYAEQHHRLKP